MSRIDLSRQMIRARQMDNWHKSTKFLKRLHGGVTNESGVFIQAEEIELPRIGKSTASIRVAENGHGLWIVSTDYMHSIGGAGYAPSVWTRTAYESREEAISAGRSELVESFLSLASEKGSGLPDSTKAEARRMVAALISPIPAKPQAKQLALF